MLIFVTPTVDLPLIERIEVRELFGRRDYALDLRSTNFESGRLVLLHGDNGSGKTTLLRMVWNLLSSSESKGHRTYLAKTPFKTLRVTLRNSVQLTVQKTEGLLGSFVITLERPGRETVDIEFAASDDLVIRPSGARNAAVRRPRDLALRNARAHGAQAMFDMEGDAYLRNIQSEREYIEFLSGEVGSPLFLADDRSLYSDDEDIDRTRRFLSHNDSIERGHPGLLAALVFQELQVTMRRANDYLRSLALGGQTTGTVNSNSIYESLLVELSRSAGSTEDDAVGLLDEIQNRSGAFEVFGLVPNFDADRFKKLLRRIKSPQSRSIAESVLAPYLSGLQARYDALEEAKAVLNALIPTINEFFQDKIVSFAPRDGILISSLDGDRLPVDVLSSGERQLLMLLGTTLLARQDTSLFIIDEPELSLGVEWQRKIIQAMMGLTSRSSVQLVMATHSIEIISGAPEALVVLD